MLNQIAAIHGTGVAASTNSYESISTVTVSSAVSSISFSSIPSTYKHLQVRWLAKTSDANYNAISIRYNSDSGSNYAWHTFYGTGSSVVTETGTSDTNIRSLAMSGTNFTNIFNVGVYDILDYANTSKYKTSRVLTGIDTNGGGYMNMGSGLWMNTNAISTITILPFNGSATLQQYSQFALYGIKG